MLVHHKIDSQNKIINVGNTGENVEILTNSIIELDKHADVVTVTVNKPFLDSGSYQNNDERM